MDSFQFSSILKDGTIYYPNKFRKFYPFPTIHFASTVFQNQLDFGNSIYSSFLDRDVHTVLAVAPTQSGKTGSMLATIQHFLADPLLSLPIHHIFVITGHSSTEWTEQTKLRFPKEFRNNIFHRNQLSLFSQKVSTLSNVLVFIDESHIAARKHQSVHSALSGIDFYSRDFKLVLVTATPDLCIKHFDIHATIHMPVPQDYCSIQHLSDLGLILSAKDLSSPSSIPNILEIKSLLSFLPKFHIIRTPRGDGFRSTIDNFITVFGHSVSYVSNPTNFDFLEFQPDIHTFVFIIDRLRCAKTIHKQFIGVLYERSPKIVNRDSIIQGLLGRATGYHNFSPTVFTHF